MKKILILAMAALFGVSHASADNFTAGNITVPKGGSAVIEIGLDNTDNLCKGFQFLLNFDGAVTASSPVRGARVSDTYTLESSQKEGGYQILAYTTGTTTLTGTSGTIVRITLTADESLGVGATVTGTLSDGRISDETGTSHHLSDVEFTVTIIEKTYTVLDETSTTAPEASDGEVDIQVKRTIKANEWSTLVLPLDMTEAQLKEALGNDVMLAEFQNYVAAYTGDDVTGLTINFVPTDLSAGFYANYPYLVKTSKDITEFFVTAIIDPDEEEAKAEYDNGKTGPKRKVYGSLIGTYHAGDAIPANGLFLSGNQFWYSTGATKIKAFRAYFMLNEVLTEAEGASANIRYTVYDEATGIKEMVNVKGQKEAADGWYTLDGRKLSGKPTEKGVYIFNNKKVAIQ